MVDVITNSIEQFLLILNFSRVFEYDVHTTPGETYICNIKYISVDFIQWIFYSVYTEDNEMDRVYAKDWTWLPRCFPDQASMCSFFFFRLDTLNFPRTQTGRSINFDCRKDRRFVCYFSVTNRSKVSYVYPSSDCLSAPDFGRSNFFLNWKQYAIFSETSTKELLLEGIGILRKFFSLLISKLVKLPKLCERNHTKFDIFMMNCTVKINGYWNFYWKIKGCISMMGD